MKALTNKEMRSVRGGVNYGGCLELNPETLWCCMSCYKWGGLVVVCGSLNWYMEANPGC